MALISLPSLAPDIASIASAALVLLTFLVAARAVVAWRTLADRASGASRRRARMEQLEAQLPMGLAGLRRQARDLNAETERRLWSLSRLDDRVDDMQAMLAGQRSSLEHLGADEGRAMRGTFARIRVTLNFLRGMRDLRRTILG